MEKKESEQWKLVEEISSSSPLTIIRFIESVLSSYIPNARMGFEMNKVHQLVTKFHQLDPWECVNVLYNLVPIVQSIIADMGKAYVEEEKKRMSMLLETSGEQREETWNHVQHIVRRSHEDSKFTFADVRATTSNELHQQDNHFFSDMRVAVTAWVKKSPEAQKWWEETCWDANIEDLAVEFGICGLPEGLQKELEKVGIRELKIEICCYEDTGSNWTYDACLVNEADLED